MSGANDTYSVTFRNPGTYTYDCGVHGSAMTGQVVVQ
jgi:plastocyanin